MVTFGFHTQKRCQVTLGGNKKVFLYVCSLKDAVHLLLDFQHLLQLLLQNRFSIDIYHMKEEIYQQSENTAFTHLFGVLVKMYSKQLWEETMGQIDKWNLQGIHERSSGNWVLKRRGCRIAINQTIKLTESTNVTIHIVLDYKFKM